VDDWTGEHRQYKRYQPVDRTGNAYLEVGENWSGSLTPHGLAGFVMFDDTGGGGRRGEGWCVLRSAAGRPGPRRHKALIFDCDGVLIDAEQSGHRLAFNEMWRRLGVPWHWTEEQYRAKLAVAGGRERLASLAGDPAFRARVDIPSDARAWREMVAYWHQVKTDIYLALLQRGRLSPRPGVRRLAQAAVDAGWSLAIGSSGAQRSVEAVVAHALGERLAATAAVVTGELVVAKKPAPDIYLQAAKELHIEPSRCLVVEDTEIGLRAALRAGMVCVVTPTAGTERENFAGAAVVLSALAATRTEPLRVLSNESGLVLGTEFSLRQAEALVPDAAVRRAHA